MAAATNGSALPYFVSLSLHVFELLRSERSGALTPGPEIHNQRTHGGHSIEAAPTRFWNVTVAHKLVDMLARHAAQLRQMRSSKCW